MTDNNTPMLDDNKNEAGEMKTDELKLTSTKLNKPVKLRLPSSGTAIETNPPLTVHDMLIRTAKELPNHVALVREVNGKWVEINYREYEETVRCCAKAFLKLGLERYHSVCILGFNSPEWFIADLAAICAGGIAAGIYTTNSAQACLHCAITSEVDIMVVQDDQQLQKILSIRSELPHLKAIVQYEGIPTVQDSTILSWQQLMDLGKNEKDDELAEIQKTIDVKECCTLVFTSGTVGQPKAVMLSHDNLTWDALSISERLQLERGCEVIVSYLPLSHVAAQVVDIYISVLIGMTVYFGDKNALKGSLIDTLVRAQPTRFLGVPRVWEKIHEKMMTVAAENNSGVLGAVKASLGAWAKHHGYQHNLSKMKGKNGKTLSYSIANSLIFKTIRKKLGFSRCKIFASAAAPLSADIKRYFMSLDIPIMEVFGMSEAAGAHTISTEDCYDFDSIGSNILGAKTKIINTDERGHGEICMYGRHVCMGYVNAQEKTDETIDEEGWLHSGDIGYIDDRGLVYIVGRLKELLITAGGENVPPVPIEQALQAELPIVNNCMVVGDRKKYLVVLIALRTAVDGETGVPKDDLTKDVQQWFKSAVNCTVTKLSDLLSEHIPKNPAITEEINKAIGAVNANATSNAQKLQKFAILPADFSIATGELGPTMKLKRNFVLEKYSQLIETLY